LNGHTNPLRYNVRMEILLAVGIGIGLSSVAGVRAFLPLLIADLSYSFLLNVPNLMHPFLGNSTLLWALLALAVLECVLDKLSALDRLLNWMMIPVRVAAGAVLFAATVLVLGPHPPEVQLQTLSEALPELAPWLVVGGIIAGVVAVLKVLLRPPAKVDSSGVSTRFLSVVEDVVALVGGIVGVLIPFVPLFVVGFLLFFYYRVRKRRGRKYGGLRILGD
jgi:hypothetical protein